MNHNRSIPQVQASAPRASRFTPNTFPAAAIQQEDMVVISAAALNSLTERVTKGEHEIAEIRRVALAAQSASAAQPARVAKIKGTSPSLRVRIDGKRICTLYNK